MRKLSLALLTVFGISSVYADQLSSIESGTLPENYAFQEFDNQYYIGTGMSYGNSKNGYGQNANYNTISVAFGVEKLFDMNLWLAFNGALMTGYGNLNSSNPNAVTAPMGQDPSIANLDLKVGYAFPLIKDTLMITPYGLIGRNTNLSSNSVNNNLPPGPTPEPTINATQDYFLSGGLGGRLEYRLDSVFDFYFDQNIVYNSDMSQPNSMYSNADNFSYTSTLGAKFNVWNELQLGAQAYYTHSGAVNSPTAAQQYQLVPQNEVGGMITVGLTY